ncbi:Octanoyltransferase [Candidatus Moranella endobia PCVAL]|uniref:Octanoyltransferase n=1 Tax=Moranella endobia (strain PCIT) TaxID=903503 RepID=F7XXH1_MOREP|nr:lipoyl(octanoyl) transferase LipB [Candidatus Moranella endobia]AEI74797.1 lipoate-protein ligase B [Candidatus Moranella endobia PCIT]AGJ61454.1 Octanoyltransferase [Candidatus Moranella endobia PCVAL]
MLNNIGLVIRQLDLQPYERVALAMHSFTDKRHAASDDEIWLVQHPQVFTNGQAGNNAPALQTSSIPMIKTDRGGKLTFHGPGQQIIYILLDLRRRRLGVRDLVTLLESMIIATLANFSISAHARANAPGVYVGADKICSIGLRIYKGCSLHGLALNVAMDLSPFLLISPCGYAGLRMTQVKDLSPGTGIDDVIPVLLAKCRQQLETTASEIQDWDPLQYGV